MLLETIETCIWADKIPYLESPPGWGKSAMAKVVGRHLDLPVYIVYLGHRAGNEIHGIPLVSPEPIKIGAHTRTVVESAPPRVLVEALSRHGAVLFFDELNQVSHHDIGPVMGIFNERRWADLDLPRDRIALIAAGNPVGVSAGGWKMPLPMRRRVVTIEVELDAAQFASSENFAANWGYPLPPIYRFGRALDDEARRRYRTMLAAWVHANQDCFVIRDTAAAADGFVCPATLEDAADLLASAAQLTDEKLREQVVSRLLRGAVGVGAAGSIAAFLDNLDVADARVVLDDPGAWIAAGKVPTPDKLYYFVMSLVGEQRFRTSRATRAGTSKTTIAEKSWYAAFDVIGFLIEQGCALDILVLAAIGLTAPAVKPKGATAPPPRIMKKLQPGIDLVVNSGVSIKNLREIA